MAKLSAFAAVFAALIALSAAATYTTTTVVTEINPQRQSCETEIQGMPMTHCKKYLATLSRPYEPSFLRSAVANPARYAEEHLEECCDEECCDEMRSISSSCRGDAARHMIKEMKEMWGQEEMQKMMVEKARAIPQKCNLRRYPTMV
ncbi:2s seed storage protein 1 [Phtheirospermum japonicum]|uniref:2s seed storage protein 1 n=1 Tax=Phtheirospermum japonicum TaxID=374723 RepID=A0A830BV38_9LAMI|nr:2s seed storage protein 1 [Phtheirospermum japonicum]